MSAQARIHPSDSQWAAYALGQVTDQELADWTAHLEQCPDCLKALERQRPTDDLVDQLRQVSLAAPPPSSLTDPNAQTAPGQTDPDPGIPAELARHEIYQVVRLLGKGGMGEVYLVKHRELDRLEALKVMSAQLLEDPEMVARFQREARLLAKLKHPNIVTVHHAGRLESWHFLSMEFVPGESLDKRVRDQGPLTVSEACSYAQQIALALEYAHAKHGVAHRDLKPQNLLGTPEGQVLILDFGLTRALHKDSWELTLTRSGAVLGTPDYIAPEQIRSLSKADTRADIYSLGCTLFFLLAGHGKRTSKPTQLRSCGDAIGRCQGRKERFFRSLDAWNPRNCLGKNGKLLGWLEERFPRALTLTPYFRGF